MANNKKTKIRSFENAIELKNKKNTEGTERLIY
jgi:hypothetical protein